MKLVPFLTAFFGDTTYVLKILENVKYESNDILTNIPHAGGLEALSHHIHALKVCCHLWIYLDFHQNGVNY